MYLNEQQLIGLRYYEDFQQKIPRREMILHEKIIDRVAKKIHPQVSTGGGVAGKRKNAHQQQQSFALQICVMLCGSYRRGRAQSGDIDILVWLENEDVPVGLLRRLLSALKRLKYLTDDLQLSEKGIDCDWIHHFDKVNSELFLS
jgi:DNA polymerase/3'-5' exonuclease PolX